MYRGGEEKGGVLGTLGGVAETIKEKLALNRNEEEEEEKRGSRAGGGGGRAEAVVLVVETTPTERKVEELGRVMGQTFNDVGPLEEEGTGPV